MFEPRVVIREPGGMRVTLVDSPEPTVLTYLTVAFVQMKMIRRELDAVRMTLESAQELALTQHQRPGQIMELQADVDALEELISDQIKDLIRKLAEVESGSRG